MDIARSADRQNAPPLARQNASQSRFKLNLLISFVFTLLLLNCLLFSSSLGLHPTTVIVLDVRHRFQQVFAWLLPQSWLARDFDLDHNIDLPLSSIFAPILPVDGIFEYGLTKYTERISDGGETVTTVHYNSSQRIMARYAAFSTIPSQKLLSEVVIYPGDGCSSHAEGYAHTYTDKFVVLFRGNCSFFDKAQNVIKVLKPRGVIIADNSPQRHELITMYSKNGLGDLDGEKLGVPVLFVTYESYLCLARFIKKKNKGWKSLESFDSVQFEGPKSDDPFKAPVRFDESEDNTDEPDLSLSFVQLSTIDDSRFFNVLISVIFSPPLLLFLIFLVVKHHEQQRTQPRKVDENFVKQNLPVYIYDPKFLIPQRDFNKFQKLATKLKDEFPNFAVPSVMSSLASISSLSSQVSMSHSDEYYSQLTQLILRLQNIDILVPSLGNTDFSRLNYFNTTKCAICLEVYEPWVSEIIPLAFCKHIYHRKCISKWVVNHNTKCPLCQDDITSHDYKNDDPHEGSNMVFDEESHVSGSLSPDSDGEVTPLLANTLVSDGQYGSITDSFVNHYNCVNQVPRRGCQLVCVLPHWNGMPQGMSHGTTLIERSDLFTADDDPYENPLFIDESEGQEGIKENDLNSVLTL
ncbi:hypothetical protein BABINDRAFT_127168 [Babjeviella inositovora NRRL Y-12698]|uniref:RING-type domain-containing protein n=1 Tax=Babjeviella inositovora NRRL Y-12698 TaxID=984486 RepID=A0A1E3QSW8_9ASCO|nr:uncharacterized protein BABINDRAFT_127168 [Babjeviella inositovora NRRL Y-12698]ODQ80789.1 hypothetical protein BABINDRAFT_127168 [Babjeviella inositovora NRRL Y-12698]